jgi:archaellum component FlaF (FlaF/FlaG flagellin family)
MIKKILPVLKEALDIVFRISIILIAALLIYGWFYPETEYTEITDYVETENQKTIDYVDTEVQENIKYINKAVKDNTDYVDKEMDKLYDFVNDSLGL